MSLDACWHFMGTHVSAPLQNFVSMINVNHFQFFTPFSISSRAICYFDLSVFIFAMRIEIKPSSLSQGIVNQMRHQCFCLIRFIVNDANGFKL